MSLSQPKAGVPVGSIEPFAMETLPNGWLHCNGAAISRTVYSKLFAAIGTNYGTGDGSTTFNIPDLRGQFVRGWDAGAGVDSGRVLGSSQADELKSHSHVVRRRAQYSLDGTADASSYAGLNEDKSTLTTGGTETRPVNIAMKYAIKY